VINIYFHQALQCTKEGWARYGFAKHFCLTDTIAPSDGISRLINMSEV